VLVRYNEMFGSLIKKEEESRSAIIIPPIKFREDFDPLENFQSNQIENLASSKRPILIGQFEIHFNSIIYNTGFQKF
jgi:hypothetical protein